MILFYSNYCTSCQMLMNQLDQYGVRKHFKVVNVEKLLSKGLKLPPQVQSVPTLMLLPQKQVLTGKPLFDYLLLPNKGLIFQLDKMNVKAASSSSGPSNEPSAFGFHGQSSSDLYSYLEEDAPNDSDKRYNWSNITGDDRILTPEMMRAAESDGKSSKGLPDLSQLQAERALDLQNHLNTTPMPPASTHA